MWKCRHFCPSPISVLLVSSAQDHWLYYEGGAKHSLKGRQLSLLCVQGALTRTQYLVFSTPYTLLPIVLWLTHWPRALQISWVLQAETFRSGGWGPEEQQWTHRNSVIIVLSYTSLSVKKQGAWAKSGPNQTQTLADLHRPQPYKMDTMSPTITDNNSCSPRHTMSSGFLLEIGHKCTICSAPSRSPDFQEGSRGSVLNALLAWTVQAGSHWNTSSQTEVQGHLPEQACYVSSLGHRVQM